MKPLLENIECLNCSKMNDCLQFNYEENNEDSNDEDEIPTEFKKIET
jgi:hypothetical protein